MTKHKMKKIPQKPGKADLLYKIVGFIFNKFFALEKIFESNDPRYHLSRYSNQLTALATAVVLAQDNWSSCVFWTQGDGDYLTIRSYSPGFDGNPQKVLTLKDKINLEGLVYKGMADIVCDDISDWAKRLPKEDNHIPVGHFAIVPAVSISGTEGVVFINTKAEVSYTIENDVDLLRVFADILAEGYAREKAASVNHIISAGSSASFKAS